MQKMFRPAVLFLRQKQQEMSGHSKWSTIKHKKGAKDAKRAKIFTRLIKELTVAARDGADPDANPRLRLAIQNAKGANMPKDNIQRAIKKGAGAEGESYFEQNFEGYGPGGIGIYVECTTDNTNRTVANVRSYFTKGGGNLGTNGSLDFIFDRKGVFVVEADALGELDPDEFEMELIDGGAEEVEQEEGSFFIYTSFEDFGNMNKKLEELGIEAKSAEAQRIPNSTNEVPADVAKQVLRLIEMFDEDDDVNNVYHNMELTDEVAAVLE